MGRKRDEVIWDEFEQTNDGITRCKHCRAEFRGKPSATRLRNHLLAVEGCGIRSCSQVPEHVKNALADASTSSKRPRIEPPSSINNNKFDNQGDDRQPMQEELQHIEEWLERSDTSALDRWDNTSVLHDRMAELDLCRTRPGRSIDEVNNLASTSAPQQNNEVQNGMQEDHEVVQGTDEECFQEAAELVEQSSFPDGIVLREANQSRGEELITVPLVGWTTAKRNLEKIWGCLMNEDALSIGVYGMGGVGKTTIITHIHNRLLKVDSSFDNVYWVTVSQQSSIFKLQSDISKAVKLDLSMERDERKRAAKLFHKLERCKKFVLILDDMWEKFPVENVGVPLRVNGGKLLLTTRSLKVCKEMECKEIVKVEPLSEIESWDLFLSKIGPNNVHFPPIEDIAKLMAKECAGLPLAIVVVATSMRGLEKDYEWRDALRKLKEHSKGLNEMENEVFKPLKFSYDQLGDEKLQQCLLYCSLFPEDHKIRRNDLIAYWIGEELIDELEFRMAAFDRGNAMINRLINACLLELANVDSVKMHDVIRDMALSIARVNPMFMVKAGVQLRDFPAEREWLVNLDRVSLMNSVFLKGCMNNVFLEGCSYNLSPNCPRLKTLFLQGNKHLRRLPNCFFVNMQSLNVLDLSNTGIDQLPDSLSNMGKLRVLRLRDCRSLKCIPSLARLENLQELDLSRSGVNKLPNGIERLVNLRVLDLSQSRIQGLIPREVLRKLSHLQSLRLWICDVEVLPEDFVGLGELEILKVNFSEIHSFDSYVRSQHWQRLSRYSIGLGCNSFACATTIEHKKVTIKNPRDHFLLPNDVAYLNIYGCSNRTSLVLDHVVDVNNLPMFTIHGGFIDNLKRLEICSCDQLKHLVSSSLAQQLFQNLRRLRVRDCENLVELIAAEDQSFNQSSSSHNDIVFPKLEYLYLDRLPKLKSIYRGTMVCHSLGRIEVWECPMLKKLPLSMEQDEQHTSLLLCPCLKRINGWRKWWELVEWDHPEAKSKWDPFFLPHDPSYPGRMRSCRKMSCC